METINATIENAGIMKAKIIFYIIFFIHIFYIHSMEQQPNNGKKIKRQTSATELLQKIVVPKPLRRTLSVTIADEQWVNKEVYEITRDYRKDAEEAIFEKDTIKFSLALKKIGDPQDRIDLTRRWNLLRGQKVCRGRFEARPGGSLIAHHRRMEQNGKSQTEP